MANSYFEFKQFKVEQSKVAMKVGTDGVLLGAWAGFDANPSSILDIGTGSGLIALMMAQRFTSALIHAVDIDSAACAQADDNFRLSPWSSRLSVSNKNISDVNLEDGKFDLIVCNPPFYSNAFKSVDNKRNVARHSVALPYEELFRCVSSLIVIGGLFSLIYPYEHVHVLLVSQFVVKRLFFLLSARCPNVFY